MMELWLEARDWRQGLTLVSLDIVRPVYAHLGIDIKFEETLRGLARDTLAGRNAGDIRVCTSTFEDASQFYSAHIIPFLNTFERALGTLARKQLAYWIRYVACSDDHNPWVLYHNLFSDWAANFRKSGEDNIGFLADSRVVAHAEQSANDLREVTLALARQRDKPLTDWDCPLLEARGLREIPDGSDFFPFWDEILLAVAMHKFQEFWIWLHSLIGPDDLGAISSAAAGRASRMGITFCPPHALPARP